jgi:triacylglycerol esterase/lipase EstA (alpha/beta hydrolase family)
MGLVGIAALLALASCASTVKVRTDSGRLTREGIASAELLGRADEAPHSSLAQLGQGCAHLLERARRHEARGRKKDAAADYLKAAVDAHVALAEGREVRGSQAEKAVLDVHNAAMARFAELWIDDPRRLDPGPYHLASGGENFEISLSPRSTFHRGYFDRFVPASAVEEKGMVSRNREGYGAPIVGIREKTPERADDMEFFPPAGMHTSITATMDRVAKSGGVTRVAFSLRNPMLEQTVVAGGRTLPLAADFSAPIAVVLNGRNEALEGLRGFFEAQKRLERSGIFLTEPYDPDRIPVLLIHGLISVPMIWRDIIPEMISDPKISTRYQFMTFTYPSSYPLVESAALLREQLAALRAKYDPDGRHPLSRNMVVAGHSMGGMLTHTLVADIGDNLWRQFSDTPLDEIPVEEAERERFRQLTYFDPDPAVRRAVFYSAPHRGATMASKDIAGLLSQFAKLPGDILRTTRHVADPQLRSHFKIPIQRQYTSRESLEPGAPMVAALDLSPYKKGVVYHSVIGDRGKGDTPDSSDGVVEYWSSHQAGAASELIVPTDHGSYKHPKAIEELRRVLYEHAGVR